MKKHGMFNQYMFDYWSISLWYRLLPLLDIQSAHFYLMLTNMEYHDFFFYNRRLFCCKCFFFGQHSSAYHVPTGQYSFPGNFQTLSISRTQFQAWKINFLFTRMGGNPDVRCFNDETTCKKSSETQAKKSKWANAFIP